MFKLLLLLVAVTAVCGIPHRDSFHLSKSRRSVPGGRIAGGHDADIADYPYHLILTWNKAQICGASILAPSWALTTAYCTIYTRADDLTVIAGYSPSTAGQTVDVAVIHQHPLYEDGQYDNDISVLKLAEDITVENSAPIALHDAGFVVEEGTDITITGWGETDGDGTYAKVLQVVVTKVISNEVCEEAYGSLITDSMMCAGNWEEGGETGCYGDYGDPLVVDGKQYAIASWAYYGFIYNCTTPHRPYVNTRITDESMREYVKNITGL